MAFNAQPLNISYFYEDEVFKIVPRNNQVKFGLVIENYEAFNSTDDEFEDSLKKGEVRVVWHPEGKEEIVAESQVGLADRTLMPGDVVRRMTRGETQRGYCREIFVRADVKILGSKYIVKNVCAERLKPLNTMPRDNAVCLDSWVGSTKNINERLTLKSTWGNLVEIHPDTDNFPLKDADTKGRAGFFAATSFYPGQTLISNAKYLNTSPGTPSSTSGKCKPVDRKFVVQSVEIEGVWVNWQCKASCDEVSDATKEGNGIQQPKCYVTGENLARLKRLNLYEPCMLQINDKNFLKIEADDLIVRKSHWKREKNSRYRVLRDQLLQQRQTEQGKLPVESDTTTRNSLSPGNVIPGGEAAARGHHHHGKEKSKEATESDEWQTDEEEAEDESMSDSNTTVSSCSSSATPKSSPRKSPLLVNRIRKLKKHSPSSSEIAASPPKEGEEVVTEALVVYSTATVVWQDGTVESGISSTDLCPIHHLDDHEFFPGDFVLAGGDAENVSYRDYGVIQKVDHLGRTAQVKWFSTYTCADEPRPSFRGESEVSVYDLKDHPDFQYRPGTIVIRVANFSGVDKTCTAGQVIDNFCDGYVQVWWVDGHISNCWPQDLFEVGQYDSENNFWSNDDSDNDSWETEDETSELGGIIGPGGKEVSKPQLVANLERARVAMSKLEEIFVINPNLQNQNVMKKLLIVYKKCRYLDRLMGTSFFHEEHFQGLVERVRKGGNPSTAERVKDQKIRLFNESPAPSAAAAELAVTFIRKIKLLDTKSESNSHEETSCSSSVGSSKSCNGGCPTSTSPKLLNPGGCGGNHGKVFNISTSSDISSLDDNEVSTRTHKTTSDIDDSGHFSAAGGAKSTEEVAGIGMDSHQECVCARLCALIKAQLVKALQEINSRYGQKDVIIEEYDIEVENENTEDLSDTVISFLLSQGKEAKPKLEAQQHIDVEDEEEEEAQVSTPATASVPSTPSQPLAPSEAFQILESAPNTHKYHLTVFHPTNAHEFYKAVMKEHRLLKSGLPSGVWVRTFEDRLDLLSVLIEGPKNTPYEDGLFLFDMQLGPDYPKVPPLCHYISYCTDRLNPNLYEDGKVCVSLLGTWSGRGTEVWGATSTLLQVIVSIQGLILVDEPYFNEAGYEKQKGTQQGSENSRMYNEMVILKLVQSMTKQITSPSPIFRNQILKHFQDKGNSIYERIKGYMDLSSIDGDNTSPIQITLNNSQLQSPPEFPLIPASRGFCLTLVGQLENFYKKLQAIQE